MNLMSTINVTNTRTCNNSVFRINSQIEEADIIEMGIPIFRGKAAGPNAGEKVHRYDVTFQLLLRTSLMKNMAKLKGMSEEFRE